MRTSDSTATIAPALTKALKALPAVTKDAANPHFKSRYLSLDGLLSAVREPLLANGIAVLQSADQSDDAALGVTTRLQHVSGEWIEGTVRMPLEKPTPQAAGSAITYGRRYGLEALLGITGTEDDDGNAATANQHNVVDTRPARRPEVRVSTPPTAPRLPPPVEMTTGQKVPSAAPSCPVCGGKMWDNRESKKNPKAPDYKCRDKSCEGLYWPGEWPPKESLEDMPAALVAEDADGMPF